MESFMSFTGEIEYINVVIKIEKVKIFRKNLKESALFKAINVINKHFLTLLITFFKCKSFRFFKKELYWVRELTFSLSTYLAKTNMKKG